MKQSEPKKLARFVIGAAVVLVLIQVGLYVSVMFRIQDGEQRIYTDLHRVEVEVIKLKERMEN